MNSDQEFTDYYRILQVDRNCDAKILESAYHHLAKMHHPDHTGAADITEFTEVIKAYRVLRNLDQRAAYDLLYSKNIMEERPRPHSSNNSKIDEEAALEDAEAHAKVLLLLYDRRREHAQNAGVVAFYLKEVLKCSDEHFEFHVWYLKEKGFITVTEQGTLAITIQGVDHVISTSRTTRAEKLFIAQPKDSED